MFILSLCNPDINHYGCVKDYVDARLMSEFQCHMPHQVYEQNNSLNETCVNMTLEEGKKYWVTYVVCFVSILQYLQNITNLMRLKKFTKTA